MNSFSSSQMTPSCKSAFMAFRHRSRSSKKRLYAPANDYAKGPVQVGNVWRENTIKHRLVTKHMLMLSRLTENIGT